MGICSFLVLVLNQNSCIPWPGVFSLISFHVVLHKSMCISAFGPSSNPSNSFVILLIHSVFFVMFPWLPYFIHILFCLFCFTLYRYLFNLPSFASTFWFISSSCIVIFPYVAFSFLSRRVPASFLCFIILACFCRFFIWVFSWISHPSFDFFFMIFEGIPIFSQTNFAFT